MPVKFGTDVAVTSACGPLQATYIFHAAVRKYKDSTSKQVHCKLDRKFYKLSYCVLMIDRQFLN